MDRYTIVHLKPLTLEETALVSVDGVWVKYSDVKQLEADNELLKHKLHNLSHAALNNYRHHTQAHHALAYLEETITNLKYVQDEKRIGADAIRDMLDEFKSEILDYEDWVVEYFADYADNLDSDE